MDETIISYIESLTPYLIEKRRELHEYPELAWTEYVTTYKIADELEGLGFELYVGKEALASGERLGVPGESDILIEETRAREYVPEAWLDKMAGGHTGLVAILDTGRPGKHIALRFDIDGLPISEAVDSNHHPYKNNFNSKRTGYMHACGHDGHMAIGIGVAHLVSHFKELLSGKITILYQPGEEGGRGAKPMVEKGWLDSVHYFLSGHIGIHSLSVGQISATTTRFLASTKINVNFIGESAHSGLEPNAGKNALLAAAAASLHLNGIARHGDGATRINVGRLEAGTARNIIADHATMELETRGETTEINEGFMVKEALRMIKASASMYDVKAEIDVVGTAPSAECSQEWIGIIRKSCATSKSVTKVLPSLPLGASEDVTMMIERVKNRDGIGTYMIFGTPITAGHHHPYFDFDEKVIPVAVEAIYLIINDIIGNT